MPAEYTRGTETARAGTAETLKPERTLNGFVNPAYALAPVDVELMWPPQDMPIPPCAA